METKMDTNDFKKDNESLIMKMIKNDRAGMVIALVIMVSIFTILQPNFFRLSNFLNILIAGSLMGLVAIGESYLIIAGHVDLSPGSVSAFSGVLAAILLKNGFGAVATIVLVILAGLAIGYVNSLLVNHINLEPFIATLATMSVIRGLAFIINNGKPEQIFNTAFLKLGVGRFLGVPIPVWVLIVALGVFAVILSRTRFGRNIYIIGGNPVAARLAGINSKKIITKLYMINSGLTALGGALLAARMNSGQPSASNGLEFDAVTAAILGGIAFSGGVGTLTGTILGIFVLQGFNNGLLLMNVPQFWQYVARGVLLIIALSFDYLRNLKKD